MSYVFPCGGLGEVIPASVPARRAEPGTGRAKGSPKPWDWAQAHAMGGRFPVGASPSGSSPTGRKSRQQVRSDPACLPARGRTQPGGARRQAA
jgi:hypothetical protein